MKQIHIYFSILFFVFIANSFLSQTANISEGCSPLEVQFTAPGGTTWFWDFIDGATSTLEDPIHTFTTGTYVVEYSESVAGPILGTVTITVYDKIVPEYSALTATQGCAPLAVTFEDDNTFTPSGVNITGYTWTSTGSGLSGSPVTFTYNSAGVYDLSMNVTTNLASCDTTVNFVDVVSVSSVSTNFSITPSASACNPPLIANFNDLSSTNNAPPLTYFWDFGNGNTSILQNPTSETYAAIGNYTVTLTTTDTNGCANSFSSDISVQSPTSSFVVPDTICSNTDFTPLNNSSAGTYLWDFGSNAIASTPLTIEEPTVQFTSNGLQSITLTTTSGSCSHDTTLQIFVEDPTVSFVSTPGYFCFEPATINYTGSSPNDVLSWDWSFGDDSLGTGNIIAHEYVIGDTTYSEHGENILSTTLTITTLAGCVAEFTDLDTIHLPWARFMPDVVNGCAPLTVTFSDSSMSNTPSEPIVQWEYDYGDGNSATFLNDNPNSYVFNTPGEYDVVLIITNNSGCTDTSDTIRIEVGDLVALDFSADFTSVCPGDPVTFTSLTPSPSNIDAWHYYSDEDRQFHCYQDSNAVWSYNNVTGFQDVTLTGEHNGCWSTITKPNYIEVRGPIADFNFRQDCDAPMDVLFSDSSSDATSISWDFGDGNNSATNTVPHTYIATGDYNVVLTASSSTSGCPDSKDSVTVHIRTILANFTTDTLLCGGISYDYDATPSTDVHEFCHRGYTWFFSDTTLRPLTGSSPTESIVFNTTDLQTIGLVVEDINGCVDTLIEEIKVFSGIANFSVSDTTICIPSTLTFADSTVADTVITNWDWNFGDGNTSTAQNPTNIYSTPAGNTIPVTLTTTDIMGCTATAQLNLTVYEPTSIIGVSPSPANVCVGENIDFTATDFTSQGSNLLFNYDFDDGNTSSFQNDSNEYALSGTYNVVLSYTEIATGCTDSSIVTVNVQDYPIAGFYSNIDTLAAVCPNQQVMFTDTSFTFGPALAYQWDFGTGGPIDNAQSPSTFFSAGTYDIQLVVSTSYGCTDTSIYPIHVIGPQASIIIDNNNICKGEAITFTIDNYAEVDFLSWDFGDGVVVTDTIPFSPVTHTYNFLPPSGQTFASLTAYGLNTSCPAIATVDIFIHEVRAGFTRNDGIDTVLCIGETLTLTNNSTLSDTYSWTLGDSGTSNSSTNFNYTYSVADTFDITLFVENSVLGCKDTIIKQVIVAADPILTLIGDTICSSETAIVQAQAGNQNPNYTYSWQPLADVVSPNSETTATVALTQEQYFYVSVEDLTTNCTSEDSAFVFIYSSITGNTFDTLIVVGETLNLPVEYPDNTVIFTWEPEDGLSCTQCSNPLVDPVLQNVTYYLNATDIYGCNNALYIFNIEIIPETLLEVPTTFTPNGDGTNDIIYLETWGIKELYEFEIYNRWGELIFVTTDTTVGWDGFYQGILQNNDIYVFKARALDWFNEEIIKEGHIHLMR